MSEVAFDKNLKSFLNHIASIRDTLPMIMLLLKPYNKKANDEFVGFLKNNVQEIEEDDGEKKLLVKSEESGIFKTLEKNATISSLAEKIIPVSLFVSLISNYDAFLNGLLRIIFNVKPDVLNGSEKNLSFSQLVEMQTIENARDYIIEKEIDTIMRKSHTEQFDYLEKLLAIKLRENLPIWKTFIEITERRNLFVHCDGIVSNQYLKNCEDHKIATKKIKVAQKLLVSPEYFFKAYECLYEICVKLTHTLWRKLIKIDLETADKKLNDICFDLVSNKSFNLADILLSFALKQKSHSN